jgi:hypothetical protein
VNSARAGVAGLDCSDCHDLCEDMAQYALREGMAADHVRMLLELRTGPRCVVPGEKVRT